MAGLNLKPMNTTSMITMAIGVTLNVARNRILFCDNSNNNHQYNHTKGFQSVSDHPIVTSSKQQEEEEEINAHNEREESLFSVAKDIAYLMKDDYKFLAMVIFAATASIASSLLAANLPSSIGSLVDIASSATSIASSSSSSSPSIFDYSGVLIPAVAKVFIGMFANAMIHCLSYSFLTFAAESLSEKLKIRLYQSVISQDMEFFDKTTVGSLTAMLHGDVQELKSSFKHVFTVGVGNIAALAGSLQLLYSVSPSLTLIVTLVLPTFVIIGSIYTRALRRLSKSSQSASRKASDLANESFHAIKTIRAFHSEEREIEKYENLVSHAAQLANKYGIGIGIFQSLISLASNFTFLLVTCYGGIQVSMGNMTRGQVTSFLVTTMRCQQSLAALSALSSQLNNVILASNNIFDLIETRPIIERTVIISDPKKNQSSHPIQINNDHEHDDDEHDDDEGGSGGGGGDDHNVSSWKKELNVEFRNVKFSYPSRKEANVFQDLNIMFKPGTVTAIVGKSGSGKTTVTALLERFYDVDDGKILINGIDIRQLDPKFLRSQIAMVSQEPTLFHCSIMDNIRYGNPNASDADVISAATQANANGFIVDFPDGYNTMVGERGMLLSGGQKQRIAIARAILANPNILILDEASSALDSVSEKLVQEALQKLMKGRTTIIIAHRLSTISQADNICFVHKGIVAECGSHQNLMQKNGQYALFVKTQQQL